jgi:hypothetical protein
MQLRGNASLVKKNKNHPGLAGLASNFIVIKCKT